MYQICIWKIYKDTNCTQQWVKWHYLSRDLQAPGWKYSKRNLNFLRLGHGTCRKAAFWPLRVCDCSKILWKFMDPSNSLYVQNFHSELSLFWCVLTRCFASNMRFFKSNNCLFNSHIAFRILFFLLGNILMCNVYVSGRVLGMSSFKYVLVSIDIYVMCAVKHSIETVTLLDINVHVVVSADIAVMCAIRHSL